MDRSPRSQPHDAMRQFVQTGYLSPDKLASFSSSFAVFQECRRKGQLKKRKKSSINKMMPLCQSLPEASTNRPRQRDIRTSPNSLGSQMLLRSSQLCWEASLGRSVCFLGSKERKEIPLRNWEERDPLFCALSWIAWVCYRFCSSLHGCLAAYAKCCLKAHLLSGVCLLRVTFSR